MMCLIAWAFLVLCSFPHNNRMESLGIRVAPYADHGVGLYCILPHLGAVPGL